MIQKKPQDEKNGLVLESDNAITIDFQGGGTDYGPNRLILQKQ